MRRRQGMSRPRRPRRLMCCEGWWLARRRRCCPMTTLNAQSAVVCAGTAWPCRGCFAGKPKARARSRADRDRLRAGILCRPRRGPRVAHTRPLSDFVLDQHLPATAERRAATSLSRRRSSTKLSEPSSARASRSSEPRGTSRLRVPTQVSVGTLSACASRPAHCALAAHRV